MSTMTPELAAALRKPFPAAEVGKLPRVTCGDCSDKRKNCTEHRKERCKTCLAWVSERHIHIDYVGHADVTSRLLGVDPEWNWEPMAQDERGTPVYDLDDQGQPVGMWIRLTVGGVTRLGYGSVPSGQSDAVKVLIGDALRNAAMRFGVALDLWAKGDRADPSAENATASAGQAQRRSRPATPPQNGTRQRQAATPPGEDQDFGDWADVIKEIRAAEDADKADADLKEVFKAGNMPPGKANAIRTAILAKRDQVTANTNGRVPA